MCSETFTTELELRTNTVFLTELQPKLCRMSFAYSKPLSFYQISYSTERAYVDEGFFFNLKIVNKSLTMEVFIL